MKHWKPFALLLALLTIALLTPLAGADQATSVSHQAFRPMVESQTVLATPLPQDPLDALLGKPDTASLRFLSTCEDYCDILLDWCYDECVFTPSCGCNGGFDECDDDFDACLASC